MLFYDCIYTDDFVYSKEFGFHTEHLTKHAIVQFVNQILESFEYNKYILGDFIELSKAFDKLTETTHSLKTIRQIGNNSFK